MIRLVSVPCSLVAGLSLALLASSMLRAQAMPSGVDVDVAAATTPVLADLTIEQALALADSGGPHLAPAEAEVRATQGRLQQAGLRPNPELSASESNLFNDDLSGFDGPTGAYELEQPIEVGGRRSARREAASAAVDVATWSLAAARLDARAATTQAFHAALTAAERVRIGQESLDLAGKVAAVASARVEAGRLAPVEESRASIAVASARIDLQRLELEAALDRARLAATWGGAPLVASVSGQLDDPPPLPPLDTLSAQVPAGPDLARWSAALREREGLTKLARADGRATLSIAGGFTNYHDADESAWLLGLRIGLPIFNRNQGAVSEALALRDKADAESRAAAIELGLRLAVAHQRATLAASTARALSEEIIPAAHLVFDTATEGFEAGKLPYLDALEARRTLLEARRQRLDALAIHHSARAELVRLVGKEIQ